MVTIMHRMPAPVRARGGPSARNLAFGQIRDRAAVSESAGFCVDLSKKKEPDHAYPLRRRGVLSG